MQYRGRGRARRRVATATTALALILTCLIPTNGFAQEEGEPAFTPTLFVFGATTDNELRSGGAAVGDSSLYAELELPFTFRGPRWTGGISLNPAWRKYRDLSRLDSFESSVDGWLRGALGPRTRLEITAAVVRSAQLTGLDVADIVTPRTDRIRGRGAARLEHTLNRAGDRLSLEADVSRIDYLEGGFIGQTGYGLRAGFGKALGPRLSTGVSGSASRTTYEDGGWVDTVSPGVAVDFALAPRTDLELGGGMSFYEGRSSLDGDARELSGRTVFVNAGLSHRGRSWSTSLGAARDVGSGVALGEPTRRTRVSGSLSWGDPRWRLGLSAGVARNETLFDSDSRFLLETGDGLLVTDARQIDTFSSCVDVGFRVVSWASLVSSGRYSVQRLPSASGPLDLDVYRVSVGIAIHPAAAPIRTARGAGVLTRYGRAGSIGSC